ncbi:hypothetical protein CFC21_103397 [Triticum aestivum]|uniref:VQ domain-containing protein n=2 Tax=Triticum aestivum TaxID=4565 RepID=A0A9R1N699_WHEAT|nr:hypothetical protein CFC21_103397 [Triticum aestivum]
MEEYSASSSQRGGGGGRGELQGPRPAPLRVHKDSHRIRKPPASQVRQPVIIYTVSPKVVHANPGEFMSVVQRLTGASSSSSSLPPPPQPSLPFPFFPQQSLSSMLPPALPQTLPFPFQLQASGPQAHEGALLQQQHSPAARLAAVEQASAPAGQNTGVHRGGLPPLPSILSPVPGSLPAIPPGFFSPPPSGAGGGINLFGELISPAFHGHGVLTGTTTAGASPTPMSLQYFPAAAAPSPSTPYYWDLFNNHPNHL